MTSEKHPVTPVTVANATIYAGDCRDVLGELEAESVDACVTDPPYGLHFMGKTWDAFGTAVGVDHKTTTERSGSMHAGEYDARRNGEFGAWCESWAREVYRVLKPGAHLVAFGGPRTFHRLTCGTEDAGFEIRDCLCWLFGQGFPKSMNVGRAHDAALGIEIGDEPSDFAKKWGGWGTALKPAWEPIVLARKPLIGTVAANVARFGTGALNIDGCRLEGEMDDTAQSWAAKGAGGNAGANGYAGQFSQGMKDAYRRGEIPLPSGRWPANVAMDEDAAGMMDAAVGELTRGARQRSERPNDRRENWRIAGDECDSSSGGPSRFFYTAKANQVERNAGIGGRNTHPTVKPLSLMQWLIRLVTPENGIILDPFMGSGTTGCAAALEDRSFVGIDLSDEYVEMSRKRIAYWSRIARDERNRIHAAT